MPPQPPSRRCPTHDVHVVEGDVEVPDDEDRLGGPRQARRGSCVSSSGNRSGSNSSGGSGRLRLASAAPRKAELALDGLGRPSPRYHCSRGGTSQGGAAHARRYTYPRAQPLEEGAEGGVPRARAHLERWVHAVLEVEAGELERRDAAVPVEALDAEVVPRAAHAQGLPRTLAHGEEGACIAELGCRAVCEDGVARERLGDAALTARGRKGRGGRGRCARCAS